MKIRTQLIAGIVFFALVLVVISGFIISTNQHLDRLMVREDRANNIALEVSELGYLSDDYILYREPLQAERWNTKYASIAEEITDLDLERPEQEAIAQNLVSNLMNTKVIFDEIASGSVQTDTAGISFVQLSWSRMAVQNQGMVFDASRLSGLIRAEAEELRQLRLIFIFALMGTFVAFLLTSYFVFYRRTLKSITELQEGARIIGSGNLDHTIEERADNEITELSRSFNRMTADLKTVIASRTELEREVAGRMKAEEDLIHVNEQLRRSEQDLIQRNVDLNVLNEELTATQEELQRNIDELTRTEQELRKSKEKYRNLFETMTEGFAVHEIVCNDEGKPSDYRFLNINPAFEKLTGLKRCEVLGKLVSEVLPGTEPDWIQRYGAVALTGISDRFSSYSAVLDRHYDVTVFSPAPRQFAVLFSDVTERMAAEKALRATEDRLRRFYQSGLIGVMYWNTDGRITDANDKFLEITGYTRDDLAAGRINWIAMTPPEYHYIDEYSANELRYYGVNTEPFEKEYIRKDGTRVPVTVASAMLDEARSEGVAFVLDITIRKRALDELNRKHDDLNAAYKALTATQEELQQNMEKLMKREAQLHEALAEKEALLSEIHHRVKNNLTAFISLLSLDGSSENTESGRALRNDLQNRARSMALIHETLYRTGKFSSVDMESYLTTLVGQIAASYAGRVTVITRVDARGVVLDLSRATTAGLIVNELVTNSFKYAFPPGFDCMAARGEPCTIRVGFTCEDGTYILKVGDNGRGLPGDLEPLAAKSLGLRLVNFLGRHQLRADIAVRRENGTEFILRLHDIGEPQ